MSGSALSRALLVPLPAVYLALRLGTDLAPAGAALPSAWATAWTLLAAGGALAVLPALAAWGAPAARRAALSAAALWGSTAWALGLHTALGNAAAAVLLLATAAGLLLGDPRYGGWRGVGAAGLSGLPLLAGFPGLWLLAAALGQAGRPALGLLPLLIAVVAGAAIWATTADPAPPPGRAAGAVGAMLAAGLLVGGLLPGPVLLTLAAPLVGSPPAATLAVPDWGLAALTGGGTGWPISALAVLAAAVALAGVVMLARRRAGPALPAVHWEAGDLVAVAVARAFLVARVAIAPERAPAGAVADVPPQESRVVRLLRGIGDGLVAAEGTYYLLFTVLMLLVALLALSR